jgi:hypothetical protein
VSSIGGPETKQAPHGMDDNLGRVRDHAEGRIPAVGGCASKQSKKSRNGAAGNDLWAGTAVDKSANVPFHSRVGSSI